VRRLLPLMLVLAVLGCGGDDGDESAGETTTAITASANPPGGCSQVAPPEAREEGGQSKPKEKLAPNKTHELIVETNCGEFTIRLDPKAAPNATASVAALAEAGFFDTTTFHRIVPGFVIQGGDPTATGTGGPGYATVDKPAETTTYTTGVVAMAKTQTEPPGTAGSQFFVVTAEDAGLPPEYAVIGKVTTGLNVVNRIGRLGDPASEEPTQVVVITKMRLKSS
jgi:peptidyl-prolyl cis-trans isomerase B (cyclophilin B)